MNKKITVLKGDGIGPEIVDQAIKVLNVIGEKYGHSFEYTEVDIGGCSIDKHGVPITEEGMAICKSADSVLLGAVGNLEQEGYTSVTGTARVDGDTGVNYFTETPNGNHRYVKKINTDEFYENRINELINL